MTGEKKTTDLSARLGVKRTKPSLSRFTKSSASITSPPKAAVAAAKPKEEGQHRDPLNSMLHPRKSREKDRNKTVVSKPTTSKRGAILNEDAEYEQRMSEKGDGGEPPFGLMAAERAAELENALALAREEQSSMREELVKLREQVAGQRRVSLDDRRRQLVEPYDHSQTPLCTMRPSSRPTSSNSAIVMEFEQDSRPNSRRHEDLLEQNRNLQARVAHLQDQLASQEAHFQSRMEQVRSRSESEWYDLTSRLHATEKESEERLQQLLSLKSSISSLTRMDTQITDSELTETLAQLANRVREWVVSNLRRTKLDLGRVPPETAKALETISPSYREIGPSNRLALYQSLISSTLMQIFREPVAVGLPETGPLGSVRQLAAYIREAGGGYSEWRRTTIRSLEKGAAQRVLQEQIQQLTHRLRSEIAHHIFVLTATNLTPSAQAVLDGILHSAANFQNTLLIQKAQYRVFFFHNREDQDLDFDERRMEQVNDLDTGMDDDAVIERKLSFCVFPGLEKFGDEYGEHADMQNLLLKASVCCDAL